MERSYHTIEQQLDKLGLGNISLTALQQETSPFSLFVEVVGTLLDEIASELASNHQHALQFTYNASRPKETLEQEMKEFMVTVLEYPAMDWHSWQNRQQILSWLITELESCRLLYHVKQFKVEKANERGDALLQEEALTLETLVMEMGVLFNQHDASQVHSMIPSINSLLSTSVSSRFPQGSWTKLVEQLSSQRQSTIQEIHQSIYKEYIGRRKLLMTRFQATWECFKGSPQLASKDGSQEWHKMEKHLLPENMFSWYDVLLCTKDIGIQTDSESIHSFEVPWMSPPDRGGRVMFRYKR